MNTAGFVDFIAINGETVGHLRKRRWKGFILESGPVLGDLEEGSRKRDLYLDRILSGTMQFYEWVSLCGGKRE